MSSATESISSHRRKLTADLETHNPCLKEHKLSLKCLDENNYNHDACEDYFENYRNCKKFWGSVSNERKKQGIEPFLPEPKDRAKIKEDYLKSRHKS